MRLRSLAGSGLVVLALVVGSIAGGARAQEDPGEGGGEADVSHLLRRLVRETRGVREAVASSSSGAPDLSSDLRAIRDALKPGEIAVVRLPSVGVDGPPAPAGTQETQLNDWARKGFRLVSVSQGYAYFQK